MNKLAVFYTMYIVIKIEIHHLVYILDFAIVLLFLISKKLFNIKDKKNSEESF